MSARSALSHTVHKRLTNTYSSEMKWHDTKKHNATKLPKQKLLVKINERRMIFVNKIATPDLSLHRFFFSKCTHKWHQIVIPFFPCDGFQQKRGLFYQMLPWYSLRQQSIVWRSVRSSWPLTLFILHLTHYSWLCL